MKKALLILSLLLAVGFTLSARNYKVLSCSKNVTINGQPARMGMIFPEDAIIGWTSDDQTLKVVPAGERFSSYIVLSAKDFKNKNSRSLVELLSGNTHSDRELATNDSLSVVNAQRPESPER